MAGPDLKPVGLELELLEAVEEGPGRGLHGAAHTGRALQQIRAEAVDLSVMIASKIIQRNITREDNERLIADALKQVEGQAH